jgi:predicted ArsR family transcriptional regulator
MDAIALGRRFLESTRGQVVLLLRRGARTVEELAQALGLTDNAVRSHLAALERDGLVRQDGVRRGAGVGKPATIYELHPDADPLLSRAYPPVLKTMLDVMLEQLPPDRSEAMLREVGRRLAAGVGGRAQGSAAARTEAAANVLRSLGGDVEVVQEGDDLMIRSNGCPLSVAVAHTPEMCAAVETLVAEVSGEPAHSCCQHGDRPRCCFAVGPTSDDTAGIVAERQRSGDLHDRR